MSAATTAVQAPAVTGLHLVAIGFHVIPVYSVVDGACACRDAACESPGKHPINGNGVDGASRDTGIVEHWQRKHVGCNWAIVGGKALPGGGFLYIVDVDQKDFGDETLTELGGAPPTRTVITGGGWHHYYRTELPQATCHHLEGIDLIGSGGYVVAPGSLHVSGRRYAWDNGQPDSIEIAPSWASPMRDAGPAEPIGRTLPGALKRCSAYVAKLPGAISGDWGHKATFHVAQVITRKFALDGDAAWQVMKAYNQRCVPPWKDHQLRRKLKSAKELGRMQTLEADEQEPFADAAPANDGDPAPSAASHKVTPINGHARPRSARRNRDDAIDEDAGDDRPDIRVGPDLHRVVSEAEQALVRDPDLYTRGGTLVRVVEREKDARAWIRREVVAPAIRTLTKASARDALSTVAKWSSFDKRSDEWVRCSPPSDVAETLLARGSWPLLRPLSGIATAPILRPDGTIAQDPGYDRSTGYLLAFEQGPRVSETPRRDEAIAACGRVLELVADYPFEADADRAAWLALCLTLVCRAAIVGPTPMVTVTANVRGSGKSKAIDIATLLATGRIAARATHPADEAEFGKVLTSTAVEADAVLLFDNIDRPLGGGKLDAWLTGERWADRLLGTNIKIDLPIVTVLAATGNNLEPSGDTLRRVLPIRIESDHERPETRADFRFPDLLGHVRQNRAALVRDLVTIAAAWYRAGCPRDPSIQQWGSYEAWVAIVPQICMWLGLPNPMLTREGLEEDDPKTSALRLLVSRWPAIQTAAQATGFTVRELVDRVYVNGSARQGHDDVASALETLAPGKGREPVNVDALGYVIRSAKKRKYAGKRIELTAKNADGLRRWTVR